MINTRLILALTIPTGALMTFVNEERETPQVLSASVVIYLLSALLIFSLSLISVIKKSSISLILLSMKSAGLCK